MEKSKSSFKSQSIFFKKTRKTLSIEQLSLSYEELKLKAAGMIKAIVILSQTHKEIKSHYPKLEV